jgi:heme peroxidase
MSNGSQSHSQVPKVVLTATGKIIVTGEVYGFGIGKRVEVSGYITQNNGAYIPFSYMAEVMPPVDGDLPYVTAEIDSAELDHQKDITVVMKVSETWPSVLVSAGPDPTIGIQAAWKTKNGLTFNYWGTANPGTAVASNDLQLPGAVPLQGTAATDTSRLGPSSYRWSGSEITELKHGRWWDRISLVKTGDLADAAIAGRFTKMLPDLPPAEFPPDDLWLLADEMTSKREATPASDGGNGPENDKKIAAAYTYLGQFTDHDLTFDPTSSLREFLDLSQINALQDYRTPRFDLDSLYGRGPADQPYLYDTDGVRMLPGEPLSGNPFDPGAFQVPRGPNHRALIGDPRNDENRIVSQLHSIFLRFHNQVAAHLGEHASFQEIRERVRWHYQWVLVNDFLPAIIDGSTLSGIFPDPYHTAPVPALRLSALGKSLNLMPVEFSVAAFRFGHSMIRAEYQLNTAIQRPIFSPDRDDLGGFRPIPKGWAIDWQRFINLGDGANPQAGGGLPDQAARTTQMASKIDTSLVSPLRDLPSQIAPNQPMLALRNLQRGATFGLPSGQAVAKALGLTPIPDDELVIGKATAHAKRKPLVKIAKSFACNAPLWAYILSEAQVTSWQKAKPRANKNDVPITLGPVGGTLVAGVFAALLQGDPTSYLNQAAKFSPIPDFTPDGKTFGLAELIKVALRPTK